jgi:cell division protein FtsB
MVKEINWEANYRCLAAVEHAHRKNIAALVEENEALMTKIELLEKKVQYLISQINEDGA